MIFANLSSKFAVECLFEVDLSLAEEASPIFMIEPVDLPYAKNPKIDKDLTKMETLGFLSWNFYRFATGIWERNLGLGNGWNSSSDHEIRKCKTCFTSIYKYKIVYILITLIITRYTQ